MPPAIDDNNLNVKELIPSLPEGDVALKLTCCVCPALIENDEGDALSVPPEGVPALDSVTVPLPLVQLTLNVPLVVLAELVYAIPDELVVGLIDITGSAALVCV